MKRVSVVLLFSLVLLSSCGKKDGDATSKSNIQLRRTAHKVMCYRLCGDVDGYLRMMLDYERLPREYQSQLRDLMLQHQAEEHDRMGRLTAATVVGDTLLEDGSAEVYVEMVWNDSVQERIHLPFVQHDNRWWIK